MPKDKTRATKAWKQARVNRAVKVIVAQRGLAQEQPGDDCSMLTQDGMRRCAIGAQFPKSQLHPGDANLPDEMAADLYGYDLAKDDPYMLPSEKRTFLQDELQPCHDESETVSEFLQKVRKMVKAQGLTMPAVSKEDLTACRKAEAKRFRAFEDANA